MAKRVEHLLTALLLLASGAIVWAGRDWPPPRILLRHGPPPLGGPTGQVRTIADLPFVEIEPGYAPVRRRLFLRLGDVPGRFLRPLGIDRGVRRVPDPDLFVDEWVVIPERIWIGWSLVDPRAWLEEHAPDAEGEPDVATLCRQLEAIAGGRFRPASRTEVYLAADADALDALHREVEESPGAPASARLLLTGAGFKDFLGERAEVWSLPRRRGVRLAWIPPGQPADD